MSYSTKPEDWYFDIFFDSDAEPGDSFNPQLTIGLSPEPGCLDDQLGSHCLPEEIAALLAPVGVLVECELCESIWEIQSSKTKDKLIEEIKALGFNYSEIFD